MIVTRRILLGFSVLAFLVPIISSAQSPFNMQECLTARGASSPPSLQDLQACTPKPGATRSTGSSPASPSPTASASPTAASCPNLTRTLQKGSRGTDVTQLQNFLIARGDLSAGNNTGYFGALTEAAVQKFQCSQSIVCSGTPYSTGYGLVGAKTRAAIKASCSGTTTTTPTPSSSSGGSMMDSLNAQIKQLQERIGALRSTNTTAVTRSTQTTQSTQATTQKTANEASCTFNNQTIPHGQSVTAYQSSSVQSGQTCVSQTRTCSNGALSGTYTFGACTVQAAQNTTNASCTLNGTTYAHGSSATSFYNVSSVFSQTNPTKCPAPSTRSCSNGVLSGDSSYVYTKCEDYTKFQKLSHGELTVTSAKNIGVVTAYFSASPCTTYRIDWGDGLSTIKEATASYSSCTQSSVSTYQENHTYQKSGEYTVSIARVEDAYSTHWYVPKKSVKTTTAINSATHDGCYVTTVSDGTTSSTGCGSQTTTPSTTSNTSAAATTQSSQLKITTSCSPRTLSSASQQLRKAYDTYDANFNGGMGYLTDSYLSNKDTIAGLLAHAESSWLDSYLIMFKATNDAEYIRKAIQHADIVLSKRDNLIGITNWRGESLGIWSRNDHSGTAAGPFPHLVELGLITAPIAEIAALIKTTPCLSNGTLSDGRSLSSIANTYITAVQAVDQYTNADWHTDTIGGVTIGWYTTPGPASPFNNFYLPSSKPPPINYVTAFGETLAHLYKATGDRSYYDRARAIGYWVLKDLNYLSSADAYWHYYWPRMPYYPESYTDRVYNYPEDFGHLSYTMGFIEAMSKYGMGVFDSQVNTRLAHTITRVMYRSDKGGIVFFMDGTGEEVSTVGSTSGTLGGTGNGTGPYWSGYYLFLRDWDSQIVPVVEQVLFTQKKIDTVAPSTEGMYSLAQYILYRQ